MQSYMLAEFFSGVCSGVEEKLDFKLVKKKSAKSLKLKYVDLNWGHKAC